MTSEAKPHSQGRSDTLDNIDPTVNKETGKLSHYAAYLHSPAWLVLTSDAPPHVARQYRPVIFPERKTVLLTPLHSRAEALQAQGLK